MDGLSRGGSATKRPANGRTGGSNGRFATSSSGGWAALVDPIRASHEAGKSKEQAIRGAAPPLSPPTHSSDARPGGGGATSVPFAMAHHVGTPGRTLLQGVVGLVLVPVAAGLGTYLLLGALSPMFRIVAPIAGLWAFVAMLRSRSFKREFVAKARGAIGENFVGRALHRLPAGWRVFHDVQLDHENIDHVVVSNRGVFTIEVKNYSGEMKVGPAGLFTHGQRNDRVVRQAWRQSHRLRMVLDVEVQPVLVFIARDFGTTRVGALPVMGVDALVPWLLGRTDRTLDLEGGRRVFALLETRVAGSPQASTAAVQHADRSAQPMQLRTSASRPLPAAWVANLPTAGALGMTFATGMRGASASRIQWARSLDADLERLRTVHRADVLISLMERHEYGLLEIPDLVLAVALLDRLLHHSTVLNIRGDSYRQRHRKNAGLPNLQGAKPETEELRGPNM